MFISINFLLFTLAFLNLYSTYHTYQILKDAKVRLDWSDGVIFGIGAFLSIFAIGIAIAL